jgi:transposase InsO family protein
MRRCGIRGKRQRRFVITTKADSDAAHAPNLLNRRFSPGEVRGWVADLTAIRTEEGFLFMAVVLDLSDRRVLGWSVDSESSGQLALEALRMALGNRKPQPGTLHHSDRGGHYNAAAYLSLLSRHGMQASMSRRGNCYDNAVAESFFASLKREALDGLRLQTRKQTYGLIFEYVESFYNRRRRHSTLNYLSPREYARLNQDSTLRVR